MYEEGIILSDKISRREFIKQASAVTAIALSGIHNLKALDNNAQQHIKHVVVRKPPHGRGFMTPNNGGIWSWGNEILVLYLNGRHINGTGCGSHSTQQAEPGVTYDWSRSYDGGESWTEHGTAFKVYSEPCGWPDPQPVKMTEPLNFTDGKTIINFQRDDKGKTYFYVSKDRGKNWSGPYNNLPVFLDGVYGRTNYEVINSSTMIAYMEMFTIKTDKCNRIDSYAVKTTDGGLTWNLGSKISHLPPCGSGKILEWATHPSVARVDANTLIATFRSGNQTGVWDRTGWFDATRSNDNGANWSYLTKLGDSPGNNSCPTTTVAGTLANGARRVVTMMWLRPPDKDSCANSKLFARISDDKGDTWSEPIVLRSDPYGWDTGYPIATVRSDGKIVVCYWMKTVNQDEPNYITATIWDAGFTGK